MGCPRSATSCSVGAAAASRSPEEAPVDPSPAPVDRGGPRAPHGVPTWLSRGRTARLPRYAGHGRGRRAGWWTHGLPPKSGTVTTDAAQRLAAIGGTGRHDFRAGWTGRRATRGPRTAGRRGSRGAGARQQPSRPRGHGLGPSDSPATGADVWARPAAPAPGPRPLCPSPGRSPRSPSRGTGSAPPRGGAGDPGLVDDLQLTG